MEHLHILNATQLRGLLHGWWIDNYGVMLGWALHMNFLFLPVLARMRWPKSQKIPKREVNASCWAAGRSHAGHKLAVSVYVS